MARASNNQTGKSPYKGGNPHKVSGNVKAGKGGQTYSKGRTGGSSGSNHPGGRNGGEVYKSGKAGTPVQTALKKIAGTTGRGGYRGSEVMTGSKGMSKREFPMGGDHGPDVRAGHAVMTKNMSGKHGQHGGSKDNNMNRVTGGHMLGKHCKGFGHAAYRLAGPAAQSPGHSQPRGHKSQ